MHNLTSDLDLQTLAKETGYSRTHFLRMFHTATGYAPHEYVLRIRLKRAQEFMRLGSMSLTDMAAHCGFSSHAHIKGLSSVAGSDPERIPTEFVALSCKADTFRQAGVPRSR